MVLPNNWKESEMILHGKNQNDSSLGWEEPKWFFHWVGRTKMVLPRAGKNQNGSSQCWEESEMILPVKNQMILPWGGKNQNGSSMGW